MVEMRSQTLIGDAPAFRRLINAARMVAATDASVLLIGDSGTGKEAIAREIHRRSRRADEVFCLIHCAGLAADDPLEQLDAALGAGGEGTLFLDEIGELPAGAQARLLHLLERGHAAGSGPRLIAATGRDLWEWVRTGAFREDLYHRVCVVPLEIPPLRDRVQDIAPLLDHFLGQAASGLGVEPPRFSATAEHQLRRYTWPGNVRELRNFCERMVILFPGGRLGPENLPWEIRRGEVTAENPVPFRLPVNGINLRDLEVEAIRQALALAGGNKSRAARLLGLTRDTLLYRLRKYLIQA
jgi:DNA-binding NtrC family response regulator